MSTSSGPDGERHADDEPRVDLGKHSAGGPNDAGDEPFDPYRFGKPDVPPPPEYAPPGYRPDPSRATGAAGLPPYPGPGYGQQPPGYPPAGGPPPPYPYPPSGPFGPPSYPPGSDYHGQPQGNGKATAGMVLGILSIVLCWTTLFDAVLVVLALIFSALGFSASASRRTGRGQAIAGFVCAGVGAVLAVVITIFAFHIVDNCQGIDRNSSAYRQCVRDHV